MLQLLGNDVFFIFFELLGQASADSRSRGCQQRPTGRIEHSCLCAAWLASSQLWPTRPSSRQTTAASTSSKPSLQTCMRSTHTHMPCRAPDSVVEHFHTSGDEAVLWSHAAELEKPLSTAFLAMDLLAQACGMASPTLKTAPAAVPFALTPSSEA